MAKLVQASNTMGITLNIRSVDISLSINSNENLLSSSIWIGICIVTDEMSMVRLKRSANQIIHLGITDGLNQNISTWGIKDKKKKITNTGII